MTFEKIKRKSLIVWLYTLKNWKQLKKFGTLHHLSEKLKYAVLYVTDAHLDKAIQDLNSLNFVREVEVSYRDDIDMTFKDAIPNRIDPDLKAEEKDDDKSMAEFFKGLAQELDQKDSDVEAPQESTVEED